MYVKMDSILAFSGGVDSTYCLYDYLRKNKDKTLLVHHVRMKHYEGRMEYELKAVRSILEWLRKNGLDNFVYSESGFDYGDITFVHYDIVTAGYFTGVILQNPKYRDIKYVIATTNREEAHTDSLEQVKGEKRRVLRDNLIRLVAKRDTIETVYPIYNIAKRDLVRKMPKDLFKLCWYCRRPTKEGKACGVCFTCCRVEGKRYQGKKKQS